MGMLEVFVLKFRTITKHTLPLLFNKAKQQVEANNASSDNAGVSLALSVLHLIVLKK